MKSRKLSSAPVVTGQSDKPDLLDASPSEAMVRTIADEIGKYREQLMECLSHESQLVVAYALLVLSKVNDPALNELPTELLTLHEKITVRSGSFSDKMELGAFARMLRKEAWRRGRNSARPSPADELEAGLPALRESVGYRS